MQFSVSKHYIESVLVYILLKYIVSAIVFLKNDKYTLFPQSWHICQLWGSKIWTIGKETPWTKNYHIYSQTKNYSDTRYNFSYFFTSRCRTL